MDDIGIEDARKALGEIVDRARLRGETTVITRQGRAAAVVIGIEAFSDIKDALSVIGEALARGGFSFGNLDDLRKVYDRNAGNILLPWPSTAPVPSVPLEDEEAEK
jgi:prevent-host-death family protein